MQKILDWLVSHLPVCRRISTTLTAFLVWLYTYPVLAFEQPQARDLSGITQLIGVIATWLGNIAGAIFFALFVLKGIKLASSSGNPHGKADAIGGLMWTGIGAVVTFGAAYLVGIAMGVGQNPGGVNVPTP